METGWDPAFLLVAPSAAMIRAIGMAADLGGGTSEELLSDGTMRTRGRDAMGNPFEQQNHPGGSVVVLGVDEDGRAYIEARWPNGRSRRATGEDAART